MVVDKIKVNDEIAKQFDTELEIVGHFVTPNIVKLVKQDDEWHLTCSAGKWGIVFQNPITLEFRYATNPNIDFTITPLNKVLKIIINTEFELQIIPYNNPNPSGYATFITYFLYNNDLNIITNFPFAVDGYNACQNYGFDNAPTLNSTNILTSDTILRSVFQCVSVFGEPIQIKKENGNYVFSISNGQIGFVYNNGSQITAGAINITLNTGVGYLIVDQKGNIVTRNNISIASFESIIASYYNNNNNYLLFNAMFPYIIDDDKPMGIDISQYIEIPEISENRYDYVENYPIIPGELYVLDDYPTKIYKQSMVLDPNNDYHLVLTTTNNTRHHSFEVQEPLNLYYSDSGTSAKITVEKTSQYTQNVFKDIVVHKATAASKSGKTPKLLIIGDSITHGNGGSNWTSPVYMMDHLLRERYNVTPQMMGTFKPYDVVGEGRGFFSFKSMSGYETYPYGQPYGFISYGGSLEQNFEYTTQFQNPFTFPATSSDLNTYPEYCYTNAKNYEDEPQKLSYADATAEQKANYHFFIFDFHRYLGLLGNVKPDIITIALGTNDWWQSGVNLDVTRTIREASFIYTRIRQECPNAHIGFITSNNIATTFKDDSRGDWQKEISQFLLALQKQVQAWRDGGDTKVHEIPIYANGSRWLAFDGKLASQSSDINDKNNVLVQTINSDVHLLDAQTEGYWEYMDSLCTAIMCMIE